MAEPITIEQVARHLYPTVHPHPPPLRGRFGTVFAPATAWTQACVQAETLAVQVQALTAVSPQAARRALLTTPLDRLVRLWDHLKAGTVRILPDGQFDPPPEAWAAIRYDDFSASEMLDTLLRAARGEV